MDRTSKFLQVIPDNIPDELKLYKQWVLWKAVLRDEKWTKVPYNADTGRKARVNAPKDWTDYETALKTYQVSKGKFTGIGFVLTAQDGVVGIDIDKIIKPGEKLQHEKLGKVLKPGEKLQLEKLGKVLKSGEKLQLEKLPEKIKDIIGLLDTYTEISPSGTGLRLFAFGSLPKAGRKKGNFEFYESGRFLTVTGHHLKGTPRLVYTNPQQIIEVHEKIFGKAVTNVTPKETPAKINVKQKLEKLEKTLDDDEIMRRMLQSASGGKIQQLLNGDFSAYPSQSEGDQALCGHLAFWFHRDAGRIDDIFRSSGLYRAKWDRKHHSDGRTYGQGTIDRAIAQCREVYTPRKTSSHLERNLPEAEKSQSAEQFLKEYRKISEPDQEQIKEAKAAVVRILKSLGVNSPQLAAFPF